MKAILTNIELKKILNKDYLHIKLMDEYHQNHTLNIFYNDTNFRKIIFGLMLACNNFDLMRLATSTPEPQKVHSYYTNRIEILENEFGEYLLYDELLNSYICTTNHPKVEFLNTLLKYNLNNFEKNPGEITSIQSQSGVFMLLVEYTPYGASYFTTNQIYYGFGHPLNIGDETNIPYVLEAASLFNSFLTSLLTFYHTNDLLNLGGKKDNHPKVSITLNKLHKITSITNPETMQGLILDKNYSLITNTEETKRTLKK